MLPQQNPMMPPNPMALYSQGGMPQMPQLQLDAQLNSLNLQALRDFDEQPLEPEKAFHLESLDATFNLDNIRKWLDEVRLVCPANLLVAYDNMAFDHMLFWNMVRELRKMQAGLNMENRADFLNTFSVMNYKWMKDFASKFFDEHKKAYCFFAAEADKRGFFKIADGPWGVMREFGSCHNDTKKKVD